MEMQYLETEEMWFANWDMEAPIGKRKRNSATHLANSPHQFVDKWDTPSSAYTAKKDYRILALQGMAAFNAAILRGVPAQLFFYPDENHWVLKPQNGILWQRTFFEWLDKWFPKNKSMKINILVCDWFEDILPPFSSNPFLRLYNLSIRLTQQ